MTTATKNIVGYADRLSVAPGERIRFMVSCEDGARDYGARLVRLLCTDDHPDGPGLVERSVRSDFEGTYEGRHQPLRAGSHIVVPCGPRLQGLSSFTAQAMIWPTRADPERQTILAVWSDETRCGFALELDSRPALQLRIGNGEREETFAVDTTLLTREWALVAASCDSCSGVVTLYQEPLRSAPGFPPPARVQARASLVPRFNASDTIVIAASYGHREGEGSFMAHHYNGKIEGARLADRVLGRDEIERLRTLPVPSDLTSSLVAAWDLSREIMTDRIVDVSGNHLDGRAIHLPNRAMKGPDWTGEVFDWKAAPEQYGAIHFHDDDVYDAGWDSDFALTIPDDLASGVYAARLDAGEEPEHIVFFVRRPHGRPAAPLLYLAPTATYLAYANYRVMNVDSSYEVYQGVVLALGPQDLFLNERSEYGDSLYGRHRDGSGVCYSSRFKPIVNMRPNTPLWAFNGDGYLLSWLDDMGYAVDVATDEDLHREGLDLLSPYRAVITGSHPEYLSAAMYDALEGYTRSGGRLFVAGGNSFYGRVAFSDYFPGVMETRRTQDGIRPERCEPGEHFHSLDGSLSGRWRSSGRPPNQLIGVGFTAQGMDISGHYRRTAASTDPRAQFIFNGVGADEVIGDFGICGGGAAGVELDRCDRGLGSPPHALVVARSEGHNDNMLLAKEDVSNSNLLIGGTQNPLVRADMTFFETGEGGAVFTVSSIAWVMALPHDGNRNNVSRITKNVLDRFLDPEPFVYPG